MGYVIGVDGGGSKTELLLCDARGNTVNRVIAEGSNHQICGLEAALVVLCRGVETLLEPLPGGTAQVEQAVFGLSGADFAEDLELLTAGLQRALPQLRLRVVNDVLLPMCAMAPEGAAAVSVCGAGHNTAVRCADGRVERIAALQYVLGNYGGGRMLTNTALHHAFRAAEHTGRPTALCDALPGLYGMDDLRAVQKALYHGGRNAAADAQVPRIVSRLAAEGDGVCRMILTEMGAVQAEMTAGLLRHAGLAAEKLPVILAGSLYLKDESGLVRDSYTNHLQADCPGAAIVPLDCEPVWGAVRMAQGLHKTKPACGAHAGRMGEGQAMLGETFATDKAQIAQECRALLLDQVAPFWTKRSVDPEFGGYLTCYDRNGNLYDTRKPGWFLGRTMYTFSHLYRHFGAKPEWLAVAEAGVAYLPRITLPDGRCARLLARDGTVLAGADSIFTDHFAVKGLMAYLNALGDKAPPALVEQAEQRLQALLHHVYNPQILAGECPDTRFDKHAVSFMTLAVLLEAQDLFPGRYTQELDEYVYNSLYRFASDSTQAPHEYIGVNGKPLLEGPGRLVDVGHTMESLWFAMEAARLRNRPDWNARAQQVLDWAIRFGWDSEYGGFVQHVDLEHGEPEAAFLHTDYAGTPVAWNDKIW